jgi:hypothetical protein
MVSSRTEELRRRASAAKALLSRRYNEMDEHRRNSASTFQDYLKAVDVYRAQEEAFQDMVKRWRKASEDDAIREGKPQE